MRVGVKLLVGVGVDVKVDVFTGVLVRVGVKLAVKVEVEAVVDVIVEVDVGVLVAKQLELTRLMSSTQRMEEPVAWGWKTIWVAF